LRFHPDLPPWNVPLLLHPSPLMSSHHTLTLPLRRA
jgi:hypothetical protein